MGVSFRHSAGFGKRMEYNLIGKMLMEGLDVYLPLVDDHGVDCVIKQENGVPRQEKMPHGISTRNSATIIA